MFATPLARRILPAAVSLALAAAAVTGCSAASDETSSDESLTIENCGTDVTFEHTPERAVLLKLGAVPFLHDLGVLDHVAARAGVFPQEYFDQETQDELDEVPVLTDELDTSGHLRISQEEVIGQEPDLVLGQVDNLPRESLEQVNIPLIEEPTLCPEHGDTDPSFDDIYDQMNVYGKVFGQQQRADKANAALRKRVEAATVDSQGPKRTAAVLYPTVGGGTTYAYGSSSMAHPQLEAAGFENVFADTEERVFEVTLEELLGRDPDVLILLYSEGDPEKVEDAITMLPGAENLTAVKQDDVMTQLFHFSEPATPLTVAGLEHIVDHFGTGS